MLTRFFSFWRNLFRKSRLDADLDREVRAYVDMLAEEKMQAGMSPEEARRAAFIELGGVEQVKEQVRDVRVGIFLDTLWQDLRYGFRTLTRSPGFTLVAAAALALGIGANTAIFSIVYGVLFRPLPYPDADRVALVYMRFSPQNSERGTMSQADFFDWRAQNRAFEEPAAFMYDRFDLTGTAEPEQVLGARVTAGFFSALEVRPLLGRLLLTGEDQPSAGSVAVIGEALWRRRFRADPNAIGQAITLDGSKYTIVGVMASTFHFPQPESELWTNLILEPPTRRGPFFYRGLGRLKPGVTIEQAQAETNTIGKRIEQANPHNYVHLTMPVVPLRAALASGVRLGLLVMFGAVGLVLLIAIVNVSNLLLARASTREREMAVRLSLGAGRARVVRQLLTENALLALFGGLAGLLLAYAGIQLLRVWNPGRLPRIDDIRLDGRVLAFTFVVSVVTGILFGLAPALQSSRTDLNTSLKEGGRSGTAGSARRRTLNALVVAEIALSLTLLIGAGLLLRSFNLLQQVNPGFQAPPERILTLQISPSASKYADERTGIAFYQRLLERVRHLPGVVSAGIADSLPPNRQADMDTFVIEGEPFEGGDIHPALTAPHVSPEYFPALGIPLIEGRYFTERDTGDSTRVTIISATMARRYFSGSSPIGRRFKQSTGPPTPYTPFMEIVGVVGDTKYGGLDGESEATYYLPYTQNFDSRTYLVVRSAISAASLAPAVRREIGAVDKDTVVNQVSTMEQAIFASVAQPRFRTLLLGAFAAIALLLAAIGIYGVIAYTVVQRTHEIGIRMALGAQRSHVLGMVMRRGAALALAGTALGFAGALILTRMLSSLLFGISTTDPATFAAASLGLLGVALAASFIPARRATRIDPILAVRYE